MIINRQNLDALRTGFKTVFQGQLDVTPTTYERVATVVPSTASKEEYGWLGQLPNVREWFGPRVIQNISEHDYLVKNRDFELTIGVDRNNIEDDNLGMYTPIFQAFGEAVAAWPDQLVWSLLKAGFTSKCYDGQYFFDTDHPVITENGATASVANTDGGNGRPWFLLDVSKVLKPLIWQKRKAGQFVALDRVDDENVFNKKEFQYGWDGRGNAGFGFWQFAWGSRQPLTIDSYNTAFAALQSMKGDNGRPLNVLAGNTKPLLVVTAADRVAALSIVNTQRGPAGADNVNYQTAEPLVVPWIS